MGKLIFVTGSGRSENSRRAVELARGWGDGVVFVATYRTTAADAERLERVARQRCSSLPEQVDRTANTILYPE